MGREGGTETGVEDLQSFLLTVRKKWGGDGHRNRCRRFSIIPPDSVKEVGDTDTGVEDSQSFLLTV